MSQKYLTIILEVICKTKVTLTFNQPAYAEICILNQSKLLMVEFHYD